MRIGVILPQTEIGPDPAVIREYVQTAEGLGYTHIACYEHVVGADTSTRPDWRGPYTVDSQFHEPMVLFGWIAGFSSLELVTSVLVLPQRQTVLVAKQAAEVDVLSGGRFRLGVGVGWNDVEYVALNENFHNRGRRIEEQIEVLRRLWTERVVTFEGKWHHLPGVGINPLPVQRPIPIWMGGRSEHAYRRIARLADGWMPQFPPTDEGLAIVERVRQYAREAGRDPATLGLEARLTIGNTTPDEWHWQVERWRQAGATHLLINTLGMGLARPQDHIAAIERIARELGVTRRTA
ncbi:MAG: LLM class F420-dependent oxidoreductase [Sphaerobacter sp.]|nr:LLM class F420-dependent oxidoreductase [Sphaerobacter sp.]